MKIKEFHYQKKLKPKTSFKLALKLTTESLPFPFSVTDGETSIPITVDPKVLNGYEFRKSKTFIIKQEGGVSLSNKLSLQLPQNVIGNQVTVDVKYRPFNEKVFLSGLDRLVREPYGCFEQTSSATFPMVMLLQYLKQLGTESDKTAKLKLDIEKKLQKGVKRLLGFETPTGGFEWFGKSPGHATLTAYGIWQFIEMNKLGKYVPKEVIDRSLNWLKGQFDKSLQVFKFGRGLDSFARPPQAISDVFILFVMTLLENYSVDFSSLLDPVLEKYRAKAFQDKDSYLLAFVGLAFWNQNKKSEARSVITKLLQNQLESGEFSSVSTSITRSRGKNLKLEATSICLILLQAVDFTGFASQISKGVGFLQRNMQDGYFGSTQATVLALKALAENSRNVNASKRDRIAFDVSVGNQSKLLQIDSKKPEQDTVSFALSSAKDLLVSISSRSPLKEGEKHVFAVDYSFRLPTLTESSGSPIALSASQTRGENLTKVQVKVSNRTGEDQGMAMVVLHKPSYSKLNLNDLEGLRTSGRIAFYELRNENSEIVFYWRGIKSKGEVGFELSLLDEFKKLKSDPIAVAAYLYYEKDESLVYKMLGDVI